MIQTITANTIEDSGALDLIWHVFEEFEAPDYSDEGIREFKDFIAMDAITQRMRDGELLMWGYFDEGKIVGVIATRPPCHISLLFVARQHHRKGIATKLCNAAIAFYTENSRHQEITVHSSPYAADAYRRLGFISTDTEQTVNGIRFTPMKHTFRSPALFPDIQ